MAKTEKSKDYSAGNGKKWLVGCALIALLAIVIVVVLMSIPPNTGNAVNLLRKANTNSYMDSYTEITNYNNFESKVKNTQKLNDYIKLMPTEMADVRSVVYTIDAVLDFYNDNIIFATHNKAFNKNYKSIMNGLNGAMASKNRLNDIVDEANKLANNSPSYLQVAWVKYRAEFVKWLGYNKSAIEGLKNTYQHGLGKTTNNNKASTIILNVISDYIDVIYADFNFQAKIDEKTPNATYYEYMAQGRVDAFQDFVSQNLVYSYDIKEYYFDYYVVEKYTLLNSFHEIYSESNFEPVISSIIKLSGTNVVTKSYENVVDNQGVYEKIKTFVIGGYV